MTPEERQRQQKVDAELARLKNENAALKTEFKSLTIEGPGFSGNGSNIAFDPNAIGGFGGAGGAGGSPKEVGIDDNGTINLYTIQATFVGPAT